MTFLHKQADIAAFIQNKIKVRSTSSSEEEGCKTLSKNNTLSTLEIFSGFLVEACFSFEEPEEYLETALNDLSSLLRVKHKSHSTPEWLDLNLYSLEQHFEYGRELSRFAFEEWPGTDEYGYIDFVLWMTQGHIISLEQEGIPREEALSLLASFAKRVISYEIAAQELCILVIDYKLYEDDWSLADSVCALSAYAGSCLSLPESSSLFEGRTLVEAVTNVMTHEATRMGVPGFHEWTFGLAANDLGTEPPLELIKEVSPLFENFFKTINMNLLKERGLCAAKAAGRMLAVASTGDLPYISPKIAKPLAYAAMNESFRSLEALNMVYPGHVVAGLPPKLIE